MNRAFLIAVAVAATPFFLGFLLIGMALWLAQLAIEYPSRLLLRLAFNVSEGLQIILLALATLCFKVCISIRAGFGFYTQGGESNP